MLDGIIIKTCATLTVAACLLGSPAAVASGEAKGNTAVLLEGDILAHSADQQRSVAHGQADRLWPAGVIPYVLNDDLTPGEKGRVLQAVQHWNDRTAISIIPLNDAPADLQQDYVMFTPGKGCASWVGRQGGEQEVWVGADCSAGSMIHEIGHAVGFVHEHTRPDRDQHIAIAWENIAEDKQHNFDIPNHAVKTRGAYDLDSIMHYGETFFSTNGEPTIVALNGEATNMGQRVALSVGDITAVDSLYGSDLTIASSQLSVDGNTELSVTVTNTAAHDASNVVVTIPTDGRLVLGQSDNQWQCAVNDAELVCALASLSGNGSSTLVVLVEGLSKINREFLLESKTHTSNTVNVPTSGNKVVKADSDITQAAGAGSFGWMLLLTLVPLIARRRTAI